MSTLYQTRPSEVAGIAGVDPVSRYWAADYDLLCAKAYAHERARHERMNEQNSFAKMVTG